MHELEATLTPGELAPAEHAASTGIAVVAGNLDATAQDRDDTDLHDDLDWTRIAPAANDAPRRDVDHDTDDNREPDSGLSGELTQVAVVDLLQMLHLQHKTAVLTLKTERGIGTMWLLNGSVVDAKIGRLVGDDAVYRMLAIDTGHFRTRFSPVDRPKTITLDNMNLTMEGMRRVDECNRLLTSLPDLDEGLVIDPTCLEDASAQLSVSARELATQIAAQTSIRHLLDTAERGDLETLEDVAALCRADILTPTATREATRLRPTVPESALRLARARIEGDADDAAFDDMFGETSVSPRDSSPDATANASRTCPPHAAPLAASDPFAAVGGPAMLDDDGDDELAERTTLFRPELHGVAVPAEPPGHANESLSASQVALVRRRSPHVAVALVVAALVIVVALLGGALGS